MNTIRWGIVGPGAIAHKFAKAIQKVEGAKLVAVASRTEEKGKAFAKAYNIKTVFGGYEAMAASDCVDAVYIATPHPWHKPCAEMFLKAKKHVLCEKPLCINAAQAKALQKCAKENNVFLMEAMWTRFLPATQEVVNAVRRGDIGTVLGITADFCYASTPEEEEKLFLNNMAGGSLLDVGVYDLHFAAMFLGSAPESVCGLATTKDGVDTQMHLLLRYGNEVMVSVTSAISVEKPADAYIYGSKGYIHVPHFYGANDFYVHIGDEVKHIEKPALGDGFEEEIYEACRVIRAGETESQTLPLDETIAILEIMDEARRQNNISYPFEGE